MQLGRQKMYSVPLSWSKYLLMFEPSSFVSIQFEPLIFPGAKTSIAPTDEMPHDGHSNRMLKLFVDNVRDTCMMLCIKSFAPSFPAAQTTIYIYIYISVHVY